MKHGPIWFPQAFGVNQWKIQEKLTESNNFTKKL